GAKKQEKLCQIFTDYYHNLADKMEELKISDNNRELQVRLNIAQALSCIDSFCASASGGNGFRALHRKYQVEANRQYKAVYTIIIENISKGDYENVAIPLSDIDEKSLNERDLAQIKHDLESSLYKLMTDTKNIVHIFCDNIEREEDTRSQIPEMKEKIEKVHIILNKNNLTELLDKKMKTKLETFIDDIDKILPDVLLRGLNAIETLINTNNFLEAEQGIKNFSHIHRELGNCCTSTAVKEKIKELRESLDGIVNEILQRDFEDISKYSLKSPKDLYAKLKMVALRGNVRFNQACNIMLAKIRLNFNAAIDKVRTVSSEERIKKVRSLNDALCFLPDELQGQFNVQIDEEKAR
ncbi:unnamed protein product, partial [Rotaria sp. Silwood2]